MYNAGKQFTKFPKKEISIYNKLNSKKVKTKM